jgi:hypothetical protein
MQNNLPTDLIATALLATLDNLTVQIADRIRADFARHLVEFAMEDGMGFNRRNQYNAVANESMRFSASYRYGTGENMGRLVYSAQIDNAEVESVARDEAAATLLAWHKKLVGKLGKVESCEIVSRGNYTYNLTVRKAGVADEIRIEQQIVWKTASRTHKWFAQFPARIYVGGKFTPEAKFKAMTA